MVPDGLALLRKIVPRPCGAVVAGGRARCIVFLSASTGDKRAKVVNAFGATPAEAWEALVARASDGSYADHLRRAKWLRVDWVENVERVDWDTLRRRLKQTKRNYFRKGIALDENFERAFLEMELNGNAVLYGGNKIEHAVVNEKNFLVCARQKYGASTDIDFSDDREILIFSTGGVFIDEDGTTHEIAGDGDGGGAGRRRIEHLTADVVDALIVSGSRYLARQVRPDGSFVYGYHPCFGRTIDAYNALRHASSTYAMVEAWEVTGDHDLKAAIDRSLACLTDRFIRVSKLPDGSEAAFLVDEGDEIKLGGNAVSVLALSKYAAVTGETGYLPLLDRLARGIVHMQNPETGGFIHVLNHPDLSVREAFRIIYYEGEAAFALMRIHGLTGDARWRAVVERAFDYFIAQRHWQYHDHWLGYCVNELTRYSHDERYFRFGIANIDGYIGFIRDRITTFPTLLELAMAAQQMLMRISETPSAAHLLDEVDLAGFREALDRRASHLLNGHFWPEIAMFFRSPDTIAGSFFIRHHAFRVRIDDVEHYLSGLVAYRKFLDTRADFDRLVDARAGTKP